MKAADNSQNAPSLVDSRFMVGAARRCASTVSDAQDMLRTSSRPEIKRVAMGAAANCIRLGLALASLEPQKGWTLPPPESSLYDPMRAGFSDSSYLSSQSANERAMVSMFNDEATAGRDDSVRSLARREMPVLRRDLESIDAIALILRTAPRAGIATQGAHGASTGD